ncbi:daxx-like protein isoform X2 [Megalopta genalis]|uniref:daxx-like protein isoform X2 n=1 Tax=Megalopta genalis TaxID=115081 RepID=UPI003FD44DDB
MENREIICISSDDEDTEQSGSNGRQPVIKQLKNNFIRPIKTEITPNESGEIAVCGQKRRLSQIDDDSGKGPTKILREEDVKEPNIEEGATSSGETNVCQSKADIVVKPKLVIKETRPFSHMQQDIFPMFISLCLQKDRSDDMKVITNKLKRRYEQLDQVYANSEAFINFINEKRNHIMKNKNQLYTHIVDVNNEMKRMCSGKSSLLSNNKNCIPTTQKLHDDNFELPSSDNLHTNNIDNAGVNENNVANDEEESEKSTTQKKVKLILKTMKKCELYIKKLEETEVNFDDEDNSNYMQLEKYKHRMVDLYNKYCQYTGENIDAGRQYLRPKHLSTTGIQTVDHAITNFINSKVSKLRNLKKIGTFVNAVIFPDYKDILDCVKRCNESNNLGLDVKQQQRIAKKAFIELGEYLQRSRRNDYWDTFSLFLENQEDDPATKDLELHQKLLQNKKEGEQRLTNVFNEFVKKQEDIRDGVIDAKTSSSEEDEEESAENDEEDNNNDEDEDISLDVGSLSIDKSKSSSESEMEEDDKEEEEEEEEKEKEKEKEMETEMETETEMEMEVKEQEEKQEENKEEKEETESDGNKVLTIKNDANDKVDVENPTATEINEDRETNADKLKDTDDDSDAKARNPSDVANIPKCTPESESGGTEGNDGTKISNDSVDVVSSVTLDVPIDRTKEDEANNKTEESTDNKPSEQEKPLLRVRSFARHPTTWKDGTEKAKESSTERKLENKRPALAVNNNVVDLTLDTSDEKVQV